MFVVDHVGTLNRTPEQEWEEFNDVLINYGLPVSQYVTIPDNVWNDEWDGLVFDWGMANAGNFLLDDFSRCLIKCAQDYPSRSFLINSYVSEWAIKEIIEQEELNLPNIYFHIDEFAKALNGEDDT